MKRLIAVLSILIGVSMLLGACAPAAAPVTPAPAMPTTAPAPTTVAPTAAPSAADVAASLPRNETMYFNGQQWGSVVCWNPYSSNCNNAMAIAQQDNARVTMFETPYLYDMMDGKVVSSAGRWSLCLGAGMARRSPSSSRRLPSGVMAPR